MENKNMIGYFNLAKAGDSATVRVLHSTVDKIEGKTGHWIEINGKKRVVACTGDNCPLCGAYQCDSKVYIHLWDYADNKEKVWIRTDKILPQLKEIAENWGDLNECVLKITRDKDEFPTYTVIPVNANKFEYTDEMKSLVDKNIAYRFLMTRSNEELNQWLSTGVMPEHKKKEYVPKEQWVAQQKAKKENPVDKMIDNYVNNADDGDIDDSLPF